MPGLGVSQCREAGRARWCNDSTVLISPAMPAAPSVCPMLVFTEPTINGRSAGRPALSTEAIASISIGSPTGVPVPCAST